MTLYLAIGLVAVLLVRGAEGSCDRRRADALWALAFLVLVVPAALRHDIGVDYSRFQGYEELFAIYSSGGSVEQGMDVGFVALVRAISVFTDDAQWLFVVTSALVVGLVLRACRRLSCDPALSVALFLAAGLYLESWNIVRQWVAVACVLNALGWVGSGDGPGPGGGRSALRYVAWVVVGASFHASALLWLAMWPLFSLRLDARRCVALVSGIVLAAMLLGGTVLPLAAGSRFGRYLGSEGGAYALPDPHPDVIATGVAMLALVLWARRGDRRWGRWASCLGACQAVGLALAISGLFLPAIVDRVVRYFVPLLVLELPWALERVGDRDLRRALSLATVAVWVAVTVAKVGLGGQYGVVPYQWVLG